MRSIPADAARSVVYLSVYLCVSSTRMNEVKPRRARLPNSHRSPDTISLSGVRRCELSLFDRPTSAFCVGMRPAVAPAVHSAARYTPTLNALVERLGRLSSHSHTRLDKTVLSVSCVVCRCELDDCCERVQTSHFLSATVLVVGNPIHTAEADATQTRQFCRVRRGDVNQLLLTIIVVTFIIETHFIINCNVRYFNFILAL